MIEKNAVLHSLGWGITLIDLDEHGIGRTGCYVIDAAKKTLIETGSSLGAPAILGGLDNLAIKPEQIEYIIVTHIHLDHSGGAGYILPHFPNATVVVHPRGARHLADPSRLIAGAQAVYGDLEQIFGPIEPVPDERILIRDEGEQLDLGGGRVLTFYDTPGHARHHFSIYDSESNGMFVGDTVSIRYPKQLTGYDFEPLFPSTSPSEYDKEAIFASVDKLEKLGADRVYHTHFGMTEPASYAFEQTRKKVADFDRMARETYTAGQDWRHLAEQLKTYILQDFAAQGHAVKELIGFDLDLELNAKGMLFSIEREQLQK